MRRYTPTQIALIAWARAKLEDPVGEPPYEDPDLTSEEVWG